MVVAQEPDVRIGVTKGEDPYLLYGVGGATRQSDGTIVVANCGTSELRYFDASGGFLKAVGGRGQGPGEFGLLRRIFPLGGDTIGALESGRIQIVPPGGDVSRTVRPEGGATDLLGRLSDGSFVARRWSIDSLVEREGHHRATASILLLDGNGRVVDSVVGLPSSDARPSPDPRRFPSLSFRLSRTAVFAVGADAVYYGAQDEAGITEFDVTLRPVRTITTLTRPEPVTAEVRRAFDATVREGAHRARDGFIADAPPPDGYAPMMPAFGDLVAGRDGRLWVEDPVRPGHHPLVWTAYEEGEPVARVEIPPRFFPFEFGRDWVLGVSFGERTIERIELWRLVPGEHSGRVDPPRDAEPPTLPSRCGAWTSR